MNEEDEEELCEEHSKDLKTGNREGLQMHIYQERDKQKNFH